MGVRRGVANSSRISRHLVADHARAARRRRRGSPRGARSVSRSWVISSSRRAAAQSGQRSTGACRGCRSAWISENSNGLAHGGPGSPPGGRLAARMAAMISSIRSSALSGASTMCARRFALSRRNCERAGDDLDLVLDVVRPAPRAGSSVRHAVDERHDVDAERSSAAACACTGCSAARSPACRA